MPASPWTARKIGIEMEVLSITAAGASIGASDLKAALRAQRVTGINRRAAGYYHSDGTTWDVKTDSSCGFEVASPAITLDADGHNDQLRRACRGLQTLDAGLSERCGLHVHVDVSDFNWTDLQKLVTLWSRYEPFFYAMQPGARRSNNYCPPVRMSRWTDRDNRSIIGPVLTARDTAAIQRATVAFPRGALNLAHFWRAGRIEFRLAAGSTDYEVIRQWAMLLLSLVHRVKHGTAPITPTIVQKPELGFSAKYIFRVLGLTDADIHPAAVALLSWAERRIRTFRNDATSGYTARREVTC